MPAAAHCCRPSLIHAGALTLVCWVKPQPGNISAIAGQPYRPGRCIIGLACRLILTYPMPGKTVEWIREFWKPNDHKGILDPIDARACVRFGADGTSSGPDHGGRQLRCVLSSCQKALCPAIADCGQGRPEDPGLTRHTLRAGRSCRMWHWAPRLRQCSASYSLCPGRRRCAGL